MIYALDTYLELVAEVLSTWSFQLVSITQVWIESDISLLVLPQTLPGTPGQVNKISVGAASLVTLKSVSDI